MVFMGSFRLWTWAHVLLGLFCRCAVGQQWGDWQPHSKGFVASMNDLFDQVSRMTSRQMRFDGFMNLAAAGLLIPNYTQRGWAVAKQPESVRQKLYDRLHAGLAGKPGDEHKVDQISGPRTKFIALGGLTQDVVVDLQPMHEEWSGKKLVPTTAYGLRVYQNNNSLTMHIDHHDTHVVSSIVHVDRDVDEPWPIVITGYDGVTVEYDLQPGEMLFYESAKCIHGRPRPMKGRWYSSVFVHYRPVDLEISQEKVISTVGFLHLKRAEPSADIPNMTMVGTGFVHTDCIYGWCGIAKEWPPAGGVNSEVDMDGLQPAGAFDPSASRWKAAKEEDLASPVAITFANKYKDGVEMYWIKHGREKRLVIPSPTRAGSPTRDGWKYEETYRQSTWVGHRFEAWHGAELLAKIEITADMRGKRIDIEGPEAAEL